MDYFFKCDLNRSCTELLMKTFVSGSYGFENDPCLKPSLERFEACDKSLKNVWAGLVCLWGKYCQKPEDSTMTKEEFLSCYTEIAAISDNTCLEKMNVLGECLDEGDECDSTICQAERAAVAAACNSGN